MTTLLAVFFGGGAGALARHYVVFLGTRLVGEGFPGGTLFVNVVGSFLIGFLLEASALKWNMPLELRAFLVTGFLGGFTTFSAFAFDFYKLAGTGQAVSAGVYAVLSVILSLGAVYGGVYMARGVV